MDVLTLCQSTASMSPSICEDLAKRALSAPGLYCFGEIIDAMSAKADLSDPTVAKWIQYLRLFNYGQYSEYRKLIRSNKELGALDTKQIAKLKQLTLASLGVNTRQLPFDQISKQIDIPQLTELEAFIVQAIYDNVISGKIDSLNRQLIVDRVIAREPSIDDLSRIHHTLQDWQKIIKTTSVAARGFAEQSQNLESSRRSKLIQLVHDSTHNT